MPAAAAGAVTGFSSLAAAFASSAAAAFAYAAVYVVTAVALNYGLNRLAQSLAGKPKTDNVAAARDVTVRGTVEPMQMIYGEVVTPGFIANYATSGANNNYLHFVIVVAAHQCEDITDAYLDSQFIPDADIDSGTGDVSTAEFQGEGASRLNLKRYLGTKAQTADSEMSSTGIGNWSTNHRGAGVAWVHVRLDGSDEAFPAGAPSNFRFKVKGRRLYDPAQDSTNGGSGTHRYTDATTWEWSQNAALAIRDYISGGSRWYDVATPEPRLGFGESNDHIDDAYTIAAASISDEDVAIPPAAPPTTQKRYTCDVQLSCGSTYKENLEILKSACAGNVTYVNGKYRIYAGAFDTPEVDLDEDDILGPITVPTHPSRDQHYNFIRGTFYDEDNDWQLKPFPSIRNSSYETADGGQVPRDIELHATRTAYRAQRIAILHLAQSRNKITVRFERLSPKAMAIAQHETFTVTISEYGWSQKVFRCLEWEFMPDTGLIAITAREESSATYTDPAVADYAVGSSGTVETPQLDRPTTPTSFAARSMPDGIAFSWTAPAPISTDQLYRLYEHTAQTPFSSATLVWGGKSLAVLLPRTDYTTRYYWVTSVLNGVESAATPVGNGLAAAWKGEDTSAFGVDASGKPAGIRAVESIADRSQLLFGGAGIQILSTPNTSVGYGYPAIAIDASATYQLTVRHKSSASSTDGLYLRFNELNAALPAGKTHIGHNDGAGLETVTTERTSNVDVVANGPMPGTTMVESVYTYTPTAGTKFASFSMYNFDPNTAGVVYEVEWVRLVRTGSNVNLLAQGAYATDDIIPNAATDTFVLDEPADGSQAYGAVVQPQVEVAGIDGDVSYTSPASRDTEVKVSWGVQVRISNSTSGIAIGSSGVSVTITVNGSTVWNKRMVIESYTGTDQWASFSGTRDVTVPAGQQIEVFLNMGRTFTTGGASPAQTHFWQNAFVNVKAAKA